MSPSTPHLSFPCSVSFLRDHELPHLFTLFSCPLPSALSFSLSRYTASSCCFSLKCSYVSLFPLLLVILVSLGLYVHFSPFHLSLVLFLSSFAQYFLFFFLCTFVSERFSLFLCRKPQRQIDARTLCMPDG